MKKSTRRAASKRPVKRRAVKRTVRRKKTSSGKVIAVIVAAVVVVIGVALLARSMSGGGASSGSTTARSGGSAGDNSNGMTEGTGWPPNSILSQHGIGGMPQPTGASGIKWEVNSVALEVRFASTDATFPAVRNWLTRNGFSLVNTSQLASRTNYAFQKRKLLDLLYEDYYSKEDSFTAYR